MAVTAGGEVTTAAVGRGEIGIVPAKTSGNKVTLGTAGRHGTVQDSRLLPMASATELFLLYTRIVRPVLVRTVALGTGEFRVQTTRLHRVATGAVLSRSTGAAKANQ